MKVLSSSKALARNSLTLSITSTGTSPNSSVHDWSKSLRSQQIVHRERVRGFNLGLGADPSRETKGNSRPQ